MSELYLEHVGVYIDADRFDETVAFYEDELGWHRVLESDGPSRFVILGDGRGGRIELVCGEPATVVAPTHIGVAVPRDHLESLVARLEKRGIPLDGPYAPIPGLMWVNTYDPGGNWVQFVSREVALKR
jgi:catechol 2,3-dioxygenase-like lactoylglutathione lyase family enzyme